ncbi:hypothetical protein HO995_01850 [Streptococcus suis]|nr:hypothetical protein [Streptococcus suis]
MTKPRQNNQYNFDISKLALEEYSYLKGIEAKLLHLNLRLSYLHYPDSLKKELQDEKDYLTKLLNDYTEKLTEKYGD